ncbi:DUF2079 domain-containing protein [Streptomyces sp. G-G2]|uniref:DUF2079 domain-containing protein n=1 Tax=Streptomyces sp. G-G2 TaxID=3046201 RepID=UPI0024BA367B|nr:DUF2079 domain-containing protein [Streptomyces sp. G-G2]MDJ0380598.1 DUF2079 domain-containing protein [Streptomyces sp. G-G2]
MERWAPYLLAGVLFTGYALISVLRYRRLETMSWDLGIFEQAVRAYAHLRAPVVDLKGPGANVLGDHFSPVTALLAPFYRLFPTPVTLLVAQAALFALSAVPVTRAGIRLLGRARGFAVGAGYGLSWGVQRAVEFDFHEICFAVPLIAFALEALLRGRGRAALLWALPLVLVKEDLGLTLAALACLSAWRAGRDGDRRTARLAVGAAVLGAAVTALVFSVVIPSFNTGGGYDYWDKVTGESPAAALTGGLDVKLATLGWLLIPTTGLLALRSPLLLVAVPTLGWRFLSGDPHYWSADWHYSAVLMPVLALALVDAVDRSRRDRRPWLRAYALQLPAATLASALTLGATTLPSARLAEPDTYRIPERAVLAERLFARVPDGASVEADMAPIARLTSRCRVLWIGGTRGLVPDWIVFDNSSGWVGDPRDYARQLHPGAEFVRADEAAGFVLMRRVP